MFCIGDMVAYPMHGAGVIEAIEENEILGQIKQYYVLRFAVGGMKVMVPVIGVSSVCLRYIISREECDAVLEFLAQNGGEEQENWNRRYRENLDRMRTGSVYDTAQVVRTLVQRDMEKKLSGGERKMLGNAKKILASELVLALGLGEDEVLSMIEAAASGRAG